MGKKFMITLLMMCFVISSLGNQLFTCSPRPNATVAADGTGDFKTITEAVNSIPPRSNWRFFIHVKEGTYLENVVISKEKPNVYIYGDGSSKTIVSGNLSRFDKPSFTTFQTATFSVRSTGFVAKDMQFINTAGPEKNQAVAFHSKSSESVMYRCAFIGYQDTLYAHEGEQFYRECDIVGTVDFIFGYASAVFQACTIRPRIPLMHQYITVTAQAASDPHAKSGFSIDNCTIIPFEALNFTAAVYLGRPWKPFSTVVVANTFLGQFIDPKGWISWNQESPPATLNYGEYNNHGPGSDVSNRITWIGYKPKMSLQEAQRFSVDSLINQLGWLNQTCVPFDGSI